MTGTTLLWPYIAASYGATVAALVILGLQAWSRAGRVRRRLAVLEAESPRRGERRA
jgi:hypothetical protein